MTGALVNDEALFERLRGLTVSAGGFFDRITQLQAVVGLGTDYNLRSKSGRGYLQLHLIPRPSKFYLIELVQERNRANDRQVEVHSDTRGGSSSDVVVTALNRGVRVSFQIGECLGPICGRAGLKESTFGVGLDAHLLDGRLMLSADAFDAQASAYPRVQTRAMLAVYKSYVFVTGGLDDLVNSLPLRGPSEPFDWFVGGQLRFNDKDLKSLLLIGAR
jgi:phospholipid/cholesterol/gamma-HCH transport system substrate-binding protein